MKYIIMNSLVKQRLLKGMQQKFTTFLQLLNLNGRCGFSKSTLKFGALNSLYIFLKSNKFILILERVFLI